MFIYAAAVSFFFCTTCVLAATLAQSLPREAISQCNVDPNSLKSVAIYLENREEFGKFKDYLKEKYHLDHIYLEDAFRFATYFALTRDFVTLEPGRCLGAGVEFQVSLSLRYLYASLFVGTDAEGRFAVFDTVTKEVIYFEGSLSQRVASLQSHPEFVSLKSFLISRYEDDGRNIIFALDQVREGKRPDNVSFKAQDIQDSTTIPNTAIIATIVHPKEVRRRGRGREHIFLGLRRKRFENSEVDTTLFGEDLTNGQQF
jgi:hypothetical protein